MPANSCQNDGLIFFVGKVFLVNCQKILPVCGGHYLSLPKNDDFFKELCEKRLYKACASIGEDWRDFSLFLNRSVGFAKR